jgi:3-deoxy-D-manno-octulosonate 8-phosphate phosphatase (KDO 8-P phosphatase)
MTTASLTPGFPIAPAVLERARPVRLLLLDVDGVLTDGTILLDAQGAESKSFHTRDGHGIKLLQRAGVDIGIISGRTSRAVEHRAGELGIKHLYQGCSDKLPVCRKLLAQLAVEPAHVAFLGDDVVDLPILLHVGLALTVQDAHPLVKQHVHFVTPSRGGYGAAREACELLLYAQGRYAEAMQPYLAAAP